jgi:hypothetical protein
LAVAGKIEEERKGVDLAAIERDFKEEEEQNKLLRSNRYMDFNEKEFNECVSSEEEEEQKIEINKAGGSSFVSSSAKSEN